MRRLLLLGIFGLGLVSQSGCALYYPDDGDSSYQYCDGTGCYECNDYECWQVGGGDGWSCWSNVDCAAGCWCDTDAGTCIESGYCSSDADCFDGTVCDEARSSCTPPDAIDPTYGCTNDYECAAGCYCDLASGSCVEAGYCASDAECAAGYTCDEARSSCVPAGDPGECVVTDPCAAGCYWDESLEYCVETGYCGADSDCAYLGMVCDECRSTCVPESEVPPPPPTGCTTDADCAAGELCCDGECKAPNPVEDITCTGDGECGGGTCVDGSCHAACVSDADCGTGDVCVAGYCENNALGGGECVFNADCGADLTCINGSCHTNCVSDAECANPADFCDDGVCQPDWRPVSECSIDADCSVSAGEECVDGQCLTRCMQDSDCAACPDGPVCTGGYCGE